LAADSLKLAQYLRSRQRLGKYRIERRLGIGAFAVVYQAMDTIQGIRVALKVPHDSLVTAQVLRDFRTEIRTTSRLEHQNILSLKDASIIDDRLVMVFRLGVETLDDRMRRRMSLETAMNLTEQILEGTAYAHRQRIVHCDIKPENVILFENQHVRLADFGIAKVSQRTLQGSGTGTVGYMAPEQAMGRPSLKSDVFSLGLIVYRMLSGQWPEWPYEWPFAGAHKLRGRVHPDFVAFMKKSISLKPGNRYRDADQMLSAFRRLRPRTLKFAQARRQKHTSASGRSRSRRRAA
jgi:serine/threonine protein kinase